MIDGVLTVCRDIAVVEPVVRYTRGWTFTLETRLSATRVADAFWSVGTVTFLQTYFRFQMLIGLMNLEGGAD